MTYDLLFFGKFFYLLVDCPCFAACSGIRNSLAASPASDLITLSSSTGFPTNSTAGAAKMTTS